jgi:hypothetical protein
MLNKSICTFAAAVALFGAPVLADSSVPHTSPVRKGFDISAHAVPGNRSACQLTGEAVLWVSRPVEILDDVRASLGTIEAGLAQFAPGSRLEGCVPDGVVLSLSDQFANFLVADGRSMPGGALQAQEAAALASRLAQDHYQLAELERTAIPLVDGVTVGAHGSVSYRFRIVLILDAGSGSLDAVVLRETLGTKFAPRLTDMDRRLGRLRWSSLP